MSRFGTEITSEDIVDTLSFFDSWEDRYKYIIDLGRELPELDAAQRTEENLVRGCQSQVWLVSRRDGDKLYFDADSDAFIVKGLLAVVLAAYNGKDAASIREFDIEGYFSDLNLLKHLSVTRGNGLRAMVQRIQASAAA
ncbi:SufE family protein [Halopseudomonas pachastrellae]|uniref:SufE family protein n=1 Tax=Halopseudomonas pachastrellae TaxID=254161 RepID=UPI003D7DC72B